MATPTIGCRSHNGTAAAFPCRSRYPAPRRHSSCLPPAPDNHRRRLRRRRPRRCGSAEAARSRAPACRPWSCRRGWRASIRGAPSALRDRQQGSTACRRRRLAEAAVVVADDPEGLRERLQLRVPHPPVAEAAVDQDDRCALAERFVIQAAAVDRNRAALQVRRHAGWSWRIACRQRRSPTPGRSRTSPSFFIAENLARGRHARHGEMQPHGESRYPISRCPHSPRCPPTTSLPFVIRCRAVRRIQAAEPQAGSHARQAFERTARSVERAAVAAR